MNKVYIHGITKADTVYQKFKKHTDGVLNLVEKPEDSDYIIFIMYSKQLFIDMLKKFYNSAEEDNFKISVTDEIMHSDMFTSTTYSYFNILNDYIKLLKHNKKIILTGQKLCSFSIMLHNASFNLIKREKSEIESLDAKHSLKFLNSGQFDLHSAHLVSIPKKFREVEEDSSNYIYSAHNIIINPKDSVLKPEDYEILSYGDSINTKVIHSRNNNNQIIQLDPNDDIASFYVKKTKTLFIMDNILEPAVFINENAEYLINGNLDYLYELISIIDEIK